MVELASYQARLCAIARSCGFNREDSEELAQEAFYTCWRVTAGCEPTFHQLCKSLGWRMRDLRRRQARRRDPADVDCEWLIDLRTGRDAAELHADLVFLNECIEALGPKDRFVLRRMQQGMSRKEIASILAVTDHTIGNWFNVVAKRLRSKYKSLDL